VVSGLAVTTRLIELLDQFCLQGDAPAS
jgi:hypothetical protein